MVFQRGAVILKPPRKARAPSARPSFRCRRSMTQPIFVAFYPTTCSFLLEITPHE